MNRFQAMAVITATAVAFGMWKLGATLGAQGAEQRAREYRIQCFHGNGEKHLDTIGRRPFQDGGSTSWSREGRRHHASGTCTVTPKFEEK